MQLDKIIQMAKDHILKHGQHLPEIMTNHQIPESKRMFSYSLISVALCFSITLLHLYTCYAHCCIYLLVASHLYRYRIYLLCVASGYRRACCM